MKLVINCILSVIDRATINLNHCNFLKYFFQEIMIFEIYIKKSVIFSFKFIQKRALFSCILCIFCCSYNPNLKSVFCGQTYKYVFFLLN